MRRTTLFLILASWLMADLASADPIIIVHTFDDRAPGVQAYNENDLSLFTWHEGTSATGVEIAASPFAFTQPNVVKGFVAGSGVRGEFRSTGTAQPLRLSTQVLFVTTTGPMDLASAWRLTFFDRDGRPLLFQTGTSEATTGYARRGGPGVSSFLFEPGNPLQGIDEIRYETPVVPEPSTMLLLGSGLAAAAWHRRRRAARNE